jgi:hypothetical protein
MTTTPPKTRGEDWAAHEQKFWLNKAHLNDEGQCIIPDMWPKKASIKSQSQAGVPIKPVGARSAKETLKNYLTSCAFFDKSVIYKDPAMKKPMTKDDLKQFSKGVNRGTVSAPKKVIVVRPEVVAPYYASIHLTDLEGKLTAENIAEIFIWIGTRNGFGDWRMERGGSYGAFEVIDLIESLHKGYRKGADRIGEARTGLDRKG